MAEDVRAHITGVVFQIVAGAGSKVGAGDPILILESMKMEIPVLAEVAGTIVELRVVEGEVVRDGDPIAVIEEK
jgi:acetyl-CoA carboxylase biotin carboxyl carrier protein